MTRLSCAPALNGAGVGEQITITTDADGVAETGWLPYGRYRVEETGVPADYVDKQFSMEINACENGKTYTVSVANEPMTGYLQLVKTDALDQHTIAGVQFDIYHNDQLGNGLAGTMTTDENGVAISPPLRKGQYIVREHENPTGYVSELTEQGAVVVSNKTTNLSAVNRPVQGKKSASPKTDQLTKEALAGAEFTMTRLSGLPSQRFGGRRSGGGDHHGCKRRGGVSAADMGYLPCDGDQSPAAFCGQRFLCGCCHCGRRADRRGCCGERTDQGPFEAHQDGSSERQSHRGRDLRHLPP